jgi:hypothetical protein
MTFFGVKLFQALANAFIRFFSFGKLFTVLFFDTLLG